METQPRRSRIQDRSPMRPAELLRRVRTSSRGKLHTIIQGANRTVFQSDRKRIVPQQLTALGVAYRYGSRFRIVGGYAIRPDFHLPEFDVYTESWGMENGLDYQVGKLEKKKLCQQAGKKLVSLHAREEPRLPQVLLEELSHQARPETGCPNHGMPDDVRTVMSHTDAMKGKHA